MESTFRLLLLSLISGRSALLSRIRVKRLPITCGPMAVLRSVYRLGQFALSGVGGCSTLCLGPSLQGPPSSRNRPDNRRRYGDYKSR